MKKSWFHLITADVLGRCGPGAENDLLVDRKDQYKVAGPASAQANILSQPSAGTEDKFAVAETQRRLK